MTNSCKNIQIQQHEEVSFDGRAKDSCWLRNHAGEGADGLYGYENLKGMAVDIESTLVKAMEVNQQLVVIIKNLKIPAEFGEAVMDDGQCYGFAEVAKILNNKIELQTGKQIGRDRLFEVCRDLGILQTSLVHRNEPYQQYLHYFKLVLKQTPAGIKVTPLFTGKGLAWVLPKLLEYYR
jgi:phage antirepressor YoqD-like protein